MHTFNNYNLSSFALSVQWNKDLLHPRSLPQLVLDNWKDIAVYILGYCYVWMYMDSLCLSKKVCDSLCIGKTEYGLLKNIGTRDYFTLF